MERINAPIAKGVALNLPLVFIVLFELKCERNSCSLWLNGTILFMVIKVHPGFFKDYKGILKRCLKTVRQVSPKK